MLAAVILAAGESRRMGAPKALHPYRGLTFVAHLLAAVRHPRVGVRRVVLGAGAEEIRKDLRVEDSEIVLNTDWRKGQLSSLHAALKSLPEGQIEGILLCPVDHPLITPHLVSNLIRNFDRSGKDIILPVYRGRRGHPVIFRQTLFQELLDAPHDVGARAVVRAHPGEILETPTEEEGVVLNLNDPETLLKAVGPG